jgi:hypothetical protein
MADQYPTRTGLIAFFDVLGYKSFMRHSSIEEVASVIHNEILQMPYFVRRQITQRVGEFYGSDAEAFETCIGKPVIVSDSIVWDFAFNRALRGGVETQWLAFIGGCCCLMRQMFDHGLPLRGAISYGEYYIEEGCFAGRPVVDAYDACSNLDLVGCGLTLQAERELPKGLVGGMDAIGGLMTGYAAPLKGSQAENMKLLNWAFPGGTLLQPFGECIRSRIVEAFAKHKKGIRTEVWGKVNNTEAFLLHCKALKQTWDAHNLGCTGP